MPHPLPEDLRNERTIKLLELTVVDGYTTKAAARRFNMKHATARENIERMLKEFGYANLTAARADPNFKSKMQHAKRVLIQRADNFREMEYSFTFGARK